MVKTNKEYWHSLLTANYRRFRKDNSCCKSSVCKVLYIFLIKRKQNIGKIGKGNCWENEMFAAF